MFRTLWQQEVFKIDLHNKTLSVTDVFERVFQNTYENIVY